MPRRTNYQGTKKAPRFKGTIPAGLVRSYIGRHQIKQKGTATGLSPEGEHRAQFAHLDSSGRKYRITTSTNPRAFHTGRIGAEAFRKLGGIATLGSPKAKPGKGRVLREISLDTILAGEKLSRYEKIMQGLMAKDKKLTETTAEERLLANWMRGAYTKELGNAIKITDDMIYLTFGLGKKVAENGHQNIELRNVSHSGLVEMIFMRLTGRNFHETGSGMVNPGEGLTVHFLPDGKAILEYRNKKYDVTQNLQRSIETTRSQFK
jgi:hypothetical protein